MDGHTKINKRGWLNSFFYVLLFLVSGSAFGQDNSGCIGHEQLLSIYNENLENVNLQMAEQNWLFLSNDKDVPLIIDSDTVHYNLAIWKYGLSFQDYFLYLYYRENLFNYVELVAGESCYNLLLKEVSEQSGAQFTTSERNNINVKSFNYSDSVRIDFNQNSSPPFKYSIIYYNHLEIDSIAKEQSAERIRAEELLQKEKERLDQLIKQSDHLLQRGSFDNALTTIDTIRNILPEYQELIKQKRQFIKEEIRKKRIADLSTEGERLFTDRAFNAARQKFVELLFIDPTNQLASTRKEQIDKMLEILNSRSSRLYEYSILNPDAYKSIYNILIDEINYDVKNALSGTLKFNFNIYFDTLGHNISFYDLQESTVPNFNNFLSKLARSAILTPTYKESILVSSKSGFDVDLRWDTGEIMMKKKRKKIKAPTQTTSMGNFRQIEEFLSDTLMPRGKYFFTVKDKQLAQSPTYSDINLVKYKTVGPEAMFLSMLLPGAGTMAATQGQKGVGAMLSFLTFGGGGLACLIFQKEQSKKAENALSNNDSEGFKKHDKNSNVLKYSSYICFGVSGVIYISDVINAIVKGSKNLKASKTLRKTLRNKDIEVLKEDVELNYHP